MIKTYQQLSILLILLGNAFAIVNAQSSQLQLNLLLEPGQSLEWAKEYSVLIADQLPAKVIIGNLKNENTLIGIFKITGLKQRLILHGIQNETHFILHEWLDNSIKTGSLSLQHNQDSLWGHWYNQSKSLRLPIHSFNQDESKQREIRQYQGDSQLFFTRYTGGREVLMDQSVVDSTTWKEIFIPHKRCYDIKINNRINEFCQTGHLKLYSYHRVDLVRILHGQIPQIPHDETFNSRITEWIDDWADLVFQDSLRDITDQRWSRNQAVWFIPDFLGDDLISGILTIQFSGDQMIHSRSVIYDSKKKKFYAPEDFFRSNTVWYDDFQNMARRFIFEKYASTIEVFPEVMERIKFHMTLNPQGILISSDFTPYFGRLKVQLDHRDYEQSLQRFTPYRKFLLGQ